jgi:hypothetical protein
MEAMIDLLQKKDAAMERMRLDNQQLMKVRRQYFRN